MLAAGRAGEAGELSDPAPWRIEGGSARYRQRPAPEGCKAGLVRDDAWRYLVPVTSSAPAGLRPEGRAGRPVGPRRTARRHQRQHRLNLEMRSEATEGQRTTVITVGSGARPAQAVVRGCGRGRTRPVGVRDERNWARNGVLADWDRSSGRLLCDLAKKRTRSRICDGRWRRSRMGTQ